MVKLIKVIAFDFGGVTTGEHWGDRIYKKISAFLGVPAEKIKELRNKYNEELKRGKMKETILFQEFLNESSKIVSLKEFENFYYGLFTVNKMVLNLIKKLKKNYKIIALSNVYKKSGEFQVKKFKLQKLFDGIILSGFVGFAKPDKEIYELLIKKAKTQPNEILFIDNAEKRLIPAQKFGINTILFQSVGQLKVDLKKFGVEVK